MNRRIFLIFAYAFFLGAIMWKVVDAVRQWRYNGYIGAGFWQLLVVTLYLSVGYAVILIRISKRDFSTSPAWPLMRCLLLILWSLVTVHLDAMLPLTPRCLPNPQVYACYVVDAFFIGRMIVGKISRETGWEWQIYAMLYLWLPGMTRAYLYPNW